MNENDATAAAVAHVAHQNKTLSAHGSSSGSSMYIHAKQLATAAIAES
jgi:hypothetical protein